ncbi:PH domain-containing protein [Tessaracoccus sp. Z1128]
MQGHLLVEEGEVIIDEVRKHWAATFWWYALAALGIPLLVAALGARDLWLIPVVLGASALAVGLWKVHVAHMDRFVITNMRVFRVHGVFDRSLATMPMTRILDISMYRSLVGQVLGYGHFVFESAAQGQGLREIRYVGDPDRRDLTIQRVIQRSGLRQTMRMDPVSLDSPNEADGI